MLATQVAFSHSYPPLIYYLTERSLFKNSPHGKILKKGPDQYTKKNLLNVCLHIKFILLTTPHVVHTCDNVIGHKLNYIYQFIMKSTAIRWRKKLFAEGSRRKKIVCNDNNTKQNCLR
jgi:hypothetical protein